jgi:hypothetical protein
MVLGPLLLAGGILWGQTQPAPAGGEAAAVRELARQLNATGLAERDAAEKKLLEMGPEILDFLPPVTERTPAEVKQRLARIRQALQQRQGEATARATVVTLQGDALPLSRVLAELGKQTGNKIVDLREQFGQQVTDPKIKAALDKTPFWQALDQVLDLAGMTVYAHGGQEGITVVNRSESQAPRQGRASYDGPFRFEAIEFTAQRDLRTPANRGLQLQLEVSWEPRLAPITLRQSLTGIHATDERGQPLAIDGAKAELEVMVTRGAAAAELQIPFVLPPRNVAQIARLQGKLSAMVPGRIETFRFESIETAKKIEKRQAGVTVVLDQVRRNGAVWEVRVRVRFDKASGALESHRGWVFDNEAYLEGPDKKPIRFAGLETTLQTENEVGVAYLFDLEKGPKGHTFVYRTPGVIVIVPVQYEIKNLELP